MIFWWSDKKVNIVWQFEIFVNTGPYGAGISKGYPFLPYLDDVSQTLDK